jgi:hypothetical protein
MGEIPTSIGGLAGWVSLICHVGERERERERERRTEIQPRREQSRRINRDAMTRLNRVNVQGRDFRRRGQRACVRRCRRRRVLLRPCEVEVGEDGQGKGCEDNGALGRGCERRHSVSSAACWVGGVWESVREDLLWLTVCLSVSRGPRCCSSTPCSHANYRLFNGAYMPPAGIDKSSDYFECVSWIPWRPCCNMRQATRTKRLDDEQMDDAWAGGEVARQTRRLQAAAERAGSARVGHTSNRQPSLDTRLDGALPHVKPLCWSVVSGQWSVVAVMGTVIVTFMATVMATVTRASESVS